MNLLNITITLQAAAALSLQLQDNRKNAGTDTNISTDVPQKAANT